MNIEELREFCIALPAVTEDIKWEDHLVFSVGDKMFCLTGFEPPLQVSLKVPEEQFPDLTSKPGISQARYFARNMWISIDGAECFTHEEWEYYIRQSYDLVKEKLSGKRKKELGLS